MSRRFRAALLGLLLIPAPAPAEAERTVTRVSAAPPFETFREDFPGRIDVRGSDAANQLAIDRVGRRGFQITDSADRVVAGAGCSQEDDRAVLCRLRRGSWVDVRAHEGWDRVEVDIDFPGDIYVTGGPGEDRLIGGFDVLLIGGRGSDVLLGGPGADTLIGGKGADVERGGQDNDNVGGFIHPDPGRDRLFGGAGSDELDGIDGTEPDRRIDCGPPAPDLGWIDQADKRAKVIHGCEKRRRRGDLYPPGF